MSGLARPKLRAYRKGTKGNPKIQEELNLLKFKCTGGKVNIKAMLGRKITSALANDQDNNLATKRRKAISYKHYLRYRAKLEKAKKSLEAAKAKAANKATWDKFKAKKRALVLSKAKDNSIEVLIARVYVDEAQSLPSTNSSISLRYTSPILDKAIFKDLRYASFNLLRFYKETGKRF
ncbi:hypothetical protein BT67DRAFT_432794 [Trichocladium antarcticum]|uniref:Uncharacterized protein n=1 Tax=Trichocladium antarcticum TaxID=1450529 RepID=A0AAN6UQC8_9PEZI|nr:hypothetical protein BT67DRAFT_432794 [Trichocladium antarcticum]